MMRDINGSLIKWTNVDWRGKGIRLGVLSLFTFTSDQ